MADVTTMMGCNLKFVVISISVFYLVHFADTKILRWATPSIPTASGIYSGQISVYENLPIAYTVLRLRAETSGSEVRYKLESSSMPGWFEVEEYGTLMTRQSFDHEVATVVRLSIIGKELRCNLNASTFSATDNIGGNGTVTFDVEIINVNDNAPVFTSNVANVIIKEDTPIGVTVAGVGSRRLILLIPDLQAVLFFGSMPLSLQAFMSAFTQSDHVFLGIAVYQSKAVDRDGDELTYAIAGGNSNHTFSIGAHSGAITLASTKLLRETESFGLLITAEDGGMPRYTGSMTVNIRIWHSDNVVG